MSFLARLFKPRAPKIPIIVQDDDNLKRQLKEAKWQNARAVNSFVAASQKQEHDANLARQIIHDVLRRTETKAPNHAGNKK